MSTQALYTPAMLAAAVELADYPRLKEPTVQGSARSISCGSSLELDFTLGGQERVKQVGLTVRACAVGQAAAAIFARHVAGKSPAEIASVHDDLLAWLDGADGEPDWPDLELIAPAREYRGRHGAMMLPWRAATAALSSVATSG
ncbi:iron-sulfur cluster assembly scaffold protein [Erythrobacter alti]|uniref:iron-sulfur cluster assembly scaffold protein n=1 Tax=Erythrobacter alti TaxID=1896145 RepID=UPI0030F45A91